MYKNLSIQMVATLAKLTRLKEDEGVLLALHPDFILIVRPGMGKTERKDIADALLAAAEGLSLPVMEEPETLDDVDSKGKDGLHIPPDLLKLAGFLDLNDLTYTVENGRIIIEREDY